MNCFAMPLSYNPSSHDLEGYFESLAEQGFQNNPFFRSGTKKWGLAPPERALTFQVVSSALSTPKVRVNPVGFTLTFNCDTALKATLIFQ